MSKAKNAVTKPAPAKAQRAGSKFDAHKVAMQVALVAAAIVGGVLYSMHTPVCAGASRHDWKPSTNV